MVITPDGGTLIVAESIARRLTAYDIGTDRGPVRASDLRRRARRSAGRDRAGRGRRGVDVDERWRISFERVEAGGAVTDRSTSVTARRSPACSAARTAHPCSWCRPPTPIRSGSSAPGDRASRWSGSRSPARAFRQSKGDQTDSYYELRRPGRSPRRDVPGHRHGSQHVDVAHPARRPGVGPVGSCLAAVSASRRHPAQPGGRGICWPGFRGW